MVLTNDELDELDVRLLDALQRNARSTFAELGSLVGLKAPAVHDRVKRLEQRGYILNYSAQLDAKRLGLALTAFVSCYTSPDCKYDEFTRALGDMPEVCEVHRSPAKRPSFVKWSPAPHNTSTISSRASRACREWRARVLPSSSPRRTIAAG